MVQRGADPVNDEFEVGYNARFEAGWRWAERIGRAIMLLYVLAALVGLLGRGPLSHHTEKSPSGHFTLDYEPIARFGTETQLTFHLADANPAGAGQHQAALFIGGKVVEPLGFRRVIPEPAATIVGKDGMTLLFDVPPGEPDAIVRLMAQPSQSGPIRLTARSGGETLDWTQLVLP